MITIAKHLRIFPIICLISGLSACTNSDPQREEYIKQGRKAFNSGDYQTAQTAFNKAISSDPENSVGRFQVAEALAQLGDIESAVAQYQEVLRLDAQHVEARLKLGNIYLLAEKVELAEKLVKEVLAIAPENTDAMILLANVYAAQNNSDAAFAKVQEALTKKPDDVSATLLLATLHAKTGKTDSAFALLQQFVEKQPNNVPAQLMQFNLYNQLGQKDKAEALLVALVKIEPQQIEHRKRLAVFLMSQKQRDKAENVLRTAATELPDNEQAKLLLIEFLAAQHPVEVVMSELLPMLESNSNNYELRFKLADLQWAQKQADKAEDTLKDIIKLDKNEWQTIKAQNKLARLYKATQRFDEAKALVKTILTNHTNDNDARILDNEIALAEYRLAEAIAGFRAILAKQPNNAQVLKLLASAHLANAEPILARENLVKVLETNPNDETARLDLVNLLLQAGAKEQATEQLNVLFKLNPNSKNGLEAIFRIYMAQKQWDKALQIARQLEEVYKDDATGFYMSGLVYQEEGKLDKSAISFAQALAKQPEVVEPLAQLVKTYLALKQTDKAIHKLHDLTVQEPKHFYAYSLLGDVYVHENKLNEAISAYQKAIEIRPEWADAYRHLAIVHIKRQQADKAIEVLKEGKQKTHDALDLVADLAAIYHRAGDHQRVITLYEDLYRQNPHSPAIRQRLASYMSTYLDDEINLAKAADIAEPLTNSNNAEMLDTAGWIAYQQNNFQKAQLILSKGKQLDAANPVLNYHLGMTYFKLGENKQAKECLEKAIENKQKLSWFDEAKATLKALGETGG